MILLISASQSQIVRLTDMNHCAQLTLDSINNIDYTHLCLAPSFLAWAPQVNLVELLQIHSIYCMKVENYFPCSFPGSDTG
jgi:hypothetical protein